MFKPHARITIQVGYSINSVNGQTPQFNVLQAPGSLQYNYYQPLANIAIDIGHNLTAKAAWNYYQYGEQSLWDHSPVISTPTMRHFPFVGHFERSDLTRCRKRNAVDWSGLLDVNVLGPRP